MEVGDILLCGGRVLGMVLWTDMTMMKVGFYYDMIEGKPFFGRLKQEMLDDYREANSAEKAIYAEMLGNITGVMWKGRPAERYGHNPDIEEDEYEEDEP